MNNYSTLMYATNINSEEPLDDDDTESAKNLPNVRSTANVGGGQAKTTTTTTTQGPSHTAANLNQPSPLPFHAQSDERHHLYLENLTSFNDTTSGGFGGGGGNSGTGMRYVNSDRDLSLPFDRQRGLPSYYDSQEEVYYRYAPQPRPSQTPHPRNVVSTSSNIPPQEDQKQVSIRKYLGLGVQWVSLVTENLLSHPFIVLRRQCQVYNASQRYHLHPFSLIPSIIHLHQRQGITTLWKGLGSCLLVRGMSLAVDDILAKVTTWPKDVDSRTSLKRFGQHVLLKRLNSIFHTYCFALFSLSLSLALSISIAIVVPFYSASLVESVQSDIASEKPGLFDVFREGSLRLLYWRLPQKGRMLPVWALVGPSVTFGITRYLFSLVIKGISSRIMRRRIQQSQERKGAKFRDDSLENQNVEIYSNLIAMLTTEVIFYPFETILHRLQLQGTRTIIDNLDNGYAVVPILTNYQGAIDCYRSTVATEGFSGLYKGFGAIVLQFAAHVAVIKLTKWVVTQITEVVSSRPPNRVMQYYNLDRPTVSNSTTISPISSVSDIGGDNSAGNSVE